MMKRISLLRLLPVLFAFCFTSCETDFDVNGEWKDITVVYGLISQNDSVHYIKINKAFLGEGNVLNYAAIADSSSYGNNLEVIVTEKGLDGSSRTFTFDTTSTYSKEAGLFYYPNQLVYKAAFKIPTANLADRDYSYLVTITNKLTGKVVTAETRLVKDFEIETPRPGLQSINFTMESNQRIKWTSAKDGKRYNVSVRFWFDEDLKFSTDTIHRFIDWDFSSVKSGSIQGGEPLEISYAPGSFFTICNTLIPYKSSSKEDSVQSRLVNRVEFLFAVAGDELNTYMEVNEPSSGIVQEKPEYTNVVNGIGLFSCRYTKSTESPAVKMKIAPSTEERLISSGLKFVKKIGN